MDTNVVAVEKLALELGRVLQKQGIKLVTAESCTGGMVAQAITSVAGSSSFFESGFIPYSNAAKQSMLGVKVSSLNAFGAVSQEVAQEMAEGALLHSQASCSLAITGIAGPGGGSVEKPVGMVWFAWAYQKPGGKVVALVESQHFLGDRQAVRLQATQFALQQMLQYLNLNDVSV